MFLHEQSLLSLWERGRERGNRNRMSPQITLFIYLLLWFAGNLLFLDSYPFMHTDEPWLSGLTRTMMAEGRLDVTESFYDLYERHPHGIKVLFHLLQMVYIRVLGYSLFAVRLLSLTAGVLAICLFYRLLSLLTPAKAPWSALIAAIGISLDSQFIYASHTARQEILLVCVLLASLLLVLQENDKIGIPASGGLLGVSASIHPNAFIIAWPAGLILLILILRKKRTALQGVQFLLVCAAGAGIFVLLSFLFNPHFIPDYLAYGQPLGVTETADIKVLRWPRFHSRMFHRVSGTYYLPDIRWQYLTLPPLLLAAWFPSGKQQSTSFSGNRPPSLLLLSLGGLLGINLGILTVGKYSPPSLVFLTPFYYMAALAALMPLKQRRPKLTVLLMLLLPVIPLIFTAKNIQEEYGSSSESYRDYLAKIEETLPSSSRVLGGLSLEFYLDQGNLYHWRNLAELPEWTNPESPSPLESYVGERGIEYIVIPGEIPFIYQSRPVWNVLYGNTAFWYPQMMDFLEKECRLEAGFDSPGYGVRIAAYRNEKPWSVKIYRVLSRAER